MKERKSLISLIGLLAVCYLVTVSIVSCAKKKEPEAIKIGAILPLTGPAASFGIAMKNGILLAQERLKKEGLNLYVVIEDGQGDPKSSLMAFRKLLAAHTKIFITSVSGVCLSIIPVAQKEKVLLFAEAAHPQITGASPLVFRHSNTAPQEAEIIGNWVIKNEKVKKVFILWINDDFGLSTKNELVKILNQLELKDESYEKTQTDFKNITTHILNFNPDVVIIIGYGKSLGIAIKTLHQMNYRGKILTNLGVKITPDAVIAAGEAINGIYYNDFNFDSEDEEYIKFVKDYKQMFNEKPPAWSVLEYNTLLLLGEAIKKVGNDPEKISGYIRNKGSFKGAGEIITITPRNDMLPSLTLKKWIEQ
jgi:branched-chain amino acid transport system substrate-binding protein